MIIEFVGATTENVEAARQRLAALTTSWGYQPEPAPTTMPTDNPAIGPETKGIDPVAVASLIVSIPSAMLAVADITDRIRKRRRASEVIKHAQELEAQRATARLVHGERSIDLAALTPDQLLDLIIDEPPAS
jgi:hypothetical protein